MADSLVVVQLDGVLGATPNSQEINHTDGNLIANVPKGRVFARVTNNEAFSIGAKAISTVEVSEGSGELPVEDPIVTVPTGASRMIGPWSANFNNGSQQVELQWVDVVTDANVEIEPYKIA